jgi:hypothetical protein
MKYKKYIKTLIITELNEMNYNVEVEEGDSREMSCSYAQGLMCTCFERNL